jgi:hypothetical protein
MFLNIAPLCESFSVSLSVENKCVGRTRINFSLKGSCEGKCYGAVPSCNTKGLFALNTLTTLTGGNVGTFEGEVGKKKIQIPECRFR